MDQPTRRYRRKCLAELCLEAADGDPWKALSLAIQHRATYERAQQERHERRLQTIRERLAA